MSFEGSVVKTILKELLPVLVFSFRIFENRMSLQMFLVRSISLSSHSVSILEIRLEYLSSIPVKRPAFRNI